MAYGQLDRKRAELRCMRKGAIVERYELFVATASLAAHASYSADGFRQRDVKFLIELFSNWLEPTLQSYAIPIQNTQVQRYLNNLVEDGYARRLERRKTPCYKLTRAGVLELLTRIVDTSRVAHQQHFLFIYYFIKSYKPKLEELIVAQGKQFPRGLRLELDSLMNSKELLKREQEHIEEELEKIETRIRDARKTSELAGKMARHGGSIEQIVKEAERLYPYEFNSQKPLSSLISEIPADMRLWELETGNLMRVNLIWEPCKSILLHYQGQLEKL